MFQLSLLSKFSLSRSRQPLKKVTVPVTAVTVLRRSIISPNDPAPTKVGDVYAGKYKVEKLLGTGTRSSVWLVEDTNAPGTFRAMKVLTAAASSGREAKDELAALAAIPYSTSKMPGSEHVCALVESFEHVGSEGTYRCFVFPALGPNTNEIATGLNRILNPALHRRFCKHALLALKFLHEDCNLIHADLKPDNIFVGGPPVGEGEQHTFTLKELEQESKFHVGDFGEAVKSEGENSHTIQPVKLRAPEVVLGADWDAKVDTFSFAAMAYELAVGDLLFNPLFNSATSGMNAPETHLAQMNGLLGPFPLELLRKGDFSSDYFDVASGELLKGSMLYSAKLADLLRKSKAHLSEPDIATLADFLSKGLILDPAERWSASQLLEHPWVAGSAMS